MSTSLTHEEAKQSCMCQFTHTSLSITFLKQKSRLITKLDFMQVAEWTVNDSQHLILSKPCNGLLHLMQYGCSQLWTVCELILINPYPGIPCQRLLRQWFDSADEISEGSDLVRVSIDIKSTA